MVQNIYHLHRALIGRHSLLATFLVGLWSLHGGGCLAAMTCIGPKILVQKTSPLPASNGCSKPSALVVDGEEDFTYCCDRHDVCYATCGIDKQFCEQDFGNCMKRLCSTRFPDNAKCPQAAQMYQMGTTMFGIKGFGELQNDHCTCVDRKEVITHYRELFRGIYQMHSNKTSTEIEETVNNLMSKVGATTLVGADNGGASVVKKLAGLFYRILKKYDTAIRHEEKRLGMTPPTLPTAESREL